MVKTLLKVQFRLLISSMRFTSDQNKKRSLVLKILLGLAIAYAFGTIMLMVGLMFFSMAGQFAALDILWLYWALAGVFGVATSLVLTVFSANSLLFESKDNELLLSMPISPKAILFCRMFALYLAELFAALLIVAPAAAVYVFVCPPLSAVSALFLILGVLMLPLFTLALASAVGWAIGFVTSRIKRKNLFTTLMMFLFFGAFMYVYMNISNYIALLAQNGLAIAEVFKKSLHLFYSFGMAADGGDALAFLYTLLWCALPVIAVYYLIGRNFIKIVSANRGTAKKKYVEKSLKTSGVRAALLKKEFAYFSSVPYYMFNNSFGLIMLLLYAGVIVVKGGDFIGQFAGVSAQMGMAPESLTGVLAQVSAAAMSFCVIMNMPSCVSLSLEGKHFWIIKSSPVSFTDVVFAKAGMPVITGVPFIIAAFIATAAVLSLSFTQALPLLLLPLAVQIFTALFGLAVNLLLPKFEFTSEYYVIKQSMSAFAAVMGNMAFIAAPVVLSFTVFSGADPFLYLYAVTAVFALFSLLLFLFLVNGGKKIYERLGA